MLERRSGPRCVGANMGVGLTSPTLNQLLRLVPSRNGVTGRRLWPWTPGVTWRLGCSRRLSRMRTVRIHEGTCLSNSPVPNSSTVDIRPTIAITKAHMKVGATRGETVQKLTWNSFRNLKKAFARGDCKCYYRRASWLSFLHGL